MDNWRGVSIRRVCSARGLPKAARCRWEFIATNSKGLLDRPRTMFLILCRPFSASEDSGFSSISNEGTPREPVHIHVESDKNEAKFWVNPIVQVAYNGGYDART